MAIILSTGSNIGDRLKNLKTARDYLCQEFKLIEQSPIYESYAVDYTQQANFLNQVLAFDDLGISANETLHRLISIEKKMGRKKVIDKGPRNIDLDILFFNFETIDDENLQIPHPRLFERSFIVLPFREMNIFKQYEANYSFPRTFTNEAWPYMN